MSKVVEKMRELAREMLRSFSISNIKDEILQLNSELSSQEYYIKQLELGIARSKYTISKAEDANPDKEGIITSCNESIAFQLKSIEQKQDAIAKLKERIACWNKDIAKWESGENKVDASMLSIRTNSLIEEHFKGKARLFEATIDDQASK